MIDRRGLRPFLKWVGGKRQLLPVLRRFYPPTIGRYFEPFVGSGAVFFDLTTRGRLNGAGARLSDDNADLIACYRRVARSVNEVIDALDALAQQHAAGGRDCYLDIRDRRFNPMRAAWRARGAGLDDYPSELAAMLIYLNRTGYNGLFRLNGSGEFNVPPGRYDRPKVLDRALLTEASTVLSAPGISLEHAPFDAVLDHARRGDFVYFDPPYSPVSRTSNFRGYTGRGFSDVQQQRLQRVVIELARRGVHVLLSNSVAPDISALYENNPEVVDARLATYRFPARRSINSRPDRRGAVEELVVTNVAASP